MPRAVAIPSVREVERADGAVPGRLRHDHDPLLLVRWPVARLVLAAREPHVQAQRDDGEEDKSENPGSASLKVPLLARDVADRF
jgi:hypothetical protein